MRRRGKWNISKGERQRLSGSLRPRGGPAALMAAFPHVRPGTHGPPHSHPHSYSYSRALLPSPTCADWFTAVVPKRARATASPGNWGGSRTRNPTGGAQCLLPQPQGHALRGKVTGLEHRGREQGVRSRTCQVIGAWPGFGAELFSEGRGSAGELPGCCRAGHGLSEDLPASRGTGGAEGGALEVKGALPARVCSCGKEESRVLRRHRPPSLDGRGLQVLHLDN